MHKNHLRWAYTEKYRTQFYLDGFLSPMDWNPFGIFGEFLEICTIIIDLLILLKIGVSLLLLLGKVTGKGKFSAAALFFCCQMQNFWGTFGKK